MKVDVLEILRGHGGLDDVRAAIAELIEAHKRLLASHKDYTESQARGWPDNQNGYPNHEWSVEIERYAQAALAKVQP